MTQISFLLLLVFTFSAPVYAGTWVTSSYKGLLGTRTYKVYIPNQLPQNKKSPIVVMLHGCQQDATEFAKGTRIEKWADKEKFVALFPEQNIMNNPFKCWNWILPANNSRVGESQIIIEMLNAVIKAHNGDAKKVFAAGMSSHFY